MVTVLVLLAGVPLFLCMPPWNDVTLHDMAARSILRGGVHYRDVFDTNLPGIDWAMAAIRSAFGWSYDVLRAWDLAVIGSAAALLAGWAARAGATPAAVAWYAAAVALFYPFTTEFNHCQRDPWMLLPAAAAGWLRVRQVWRASRSPFLHGEGQGGGLSFVWSVAEGIAWGLAVWVKPHAILVGGAVWAVSAVLIGRSLGRRAVAADLVGLIAGGLLAGGLGVAWLAVTGAWPHFVEVFTEWNPAYMAGVWRGIPERAEWAFWFFRPWSLMHAAAIPVAVLGLRDALARPVDRAAAARGLLAALYLAWFTQALVLQKAFDYAHVPETVLAMAVLAARGWAVGFPFLVWFAAVGALLNLAEAVPSEAPVVRAVDPGSRFLKFEKHPLADANVLGLWPRCWREGSSPELRDRLGQYVNVHCGTRWEELDAVARFLRTVDPPPRDRELNCWHDSTHPLYLMLGLEPATRYMHYGTVFPLDGKSPRIRIREEVAASPQRYVVSDLRRMTYDRDGPNAPGAAGPHSLPAWFPRSQRDKFPWNQPVVFRAGRYVVHRVDRPPTPAEINLPDWDTLDALGPGD